MKFAICFLILLCGCVVGARADDNLSAKMEESAVALQKLKEQCDNPHASQELAWPSSVSKTELLRCQAIEKLKAQENGAQVVRNALQKAKGEYHQMLIIALAALSDKDFLLPAAKLMLNSEHSAVRVVAASELSRLSDETLIEPFKQAMKDEFERQRGGCLGPELMIYPVRMIAASALAQLGLSREEIQRLGDWQVAS